MVSAALRAAHQETVVFLPQSIFNTGTDFLAICSSEHDADIVALHSKNGRITNVVHVVGSVSKSIGQLLL